MAKEYAKHFYKSKAWQTCRDNYWQAVGGLCENCLAKGIYRPAEIIHHMIELTPDNINNPEVALNPAHLKALCRECHAEVHGARQRRYTIAPNGDVDIK